MTHKWLLIFHVLGASIWLGGHLILCIRYLPESLRKKDTNIITEFEQKFEIIGIPSLLLQLITGIWMGLNYNPKLIGFSNDIETAITIKLFLLMMIVLLAIHARLFIIPKLNRESLPMLAWHIVAVTMISVALLYLGVSIRFGGI